MSACAFRPPALSYILFPPALHLNFARSSKQARATGWGCRISIGTLLKEARRLLDPKHPSKLPRLSAALAALGKRLTVNLEDVR